MSLEELKIAPEIFLNKTTVIYGNSGSGKTTMIKDIMFHLKNHIPQVICICPSDPQNRAYSEEPIPLVPNIYIHTKITEDLLKNIYDRQKVFAAKYKEANQYVVLKSLYSKINNNRIDGIISDMMEWGNKVIMKLRNTMSEGMLDNKIKEIKDKIKTKTCEIYKNEIKKQESRFKNMSLSSAEASSLKMINFNPNLLLILDDVTSGIKQLKKSQVVQDLLFMGRHVFITTILSLHSDTAFPPDLRINTNNTLFADNKTAHAYYSKVKDSFLKEDFALIKEYVHGIRTKEEGGHNKLVYISAKNKYYSYTAEIHKAFTFGSNTIRSYNTKIKSDGITVSADNELYKSFI